LDKFGAALVSDGRGSCRKYPAGTSCGTSVCNLNRASGRVCSGAGACLDDAAGVECAPYACANGSCKAACEGDADCVATHRCAVGRCVAKEGAACDGNHTVASPEGIVEDCGLYRCEGATCKTGCTRIDDCTSPAVCSFDHRCVLGEDLSPGEAGCSVGARTRVPWGALVLACVALGARRRRARGDAL